MIMREELESKGYKAYENDEMIVYWNPKVCYHAGECYSGNIEVFDPRRRPWIDLSKAPASEIAAIVERCPSKALKYELK